MTELKPISALPASSQELVAAALAVRAKAYAPYSKFLVGCALRDGGGKVHFGCNVENASYGGTICAERSAVLQMVAFGARQIKEIAIVTTADEAFFPCGLCLQVILEFGKDAMVFAVEASGKKFRSASLNELYPSAFSKERWKHE